MKEKEKRAKGLLYDVNKDKKIKNELVNCKSACFRYNLLEPTNYKARKKAMLKILGKTKKRFNIEPNFWCDFGYNIEIGENFYANYNLVILDSAKVVFGDNVFIGPNCGFYTAGHPLDCEQRNSGLEFALPIVVGNNVWLGGNVIVLPNVTIGDNSVIGAGSVVTKSIPANVVAVGNPCKVIRAITAADKDKHKLVVSPLIDNLASDKKEGGIFKKKIKNAAAAAEIIHEAEIVPATQAEAVAEVEIVPEIVTETSTEKVVEAKASPYKKINLNYDIPKKSDADSIFSEDFLKEQPAEKPAEAAAEQPVEVIAEKTESVSEKETAPVAIQPETAAPSAEKEESEKTETAAKPKAAKPRAKKTVEKPVEKADIEINKSSEEKTNG